MFTHSWSYEWTTEQSSDYDRLENKSVGELLSDINREDHKVPEAIAKGMSLYLMAAIGDQIDLSDQLEYILSNFEQNKKAIVEDISNGT